MPVADVLFAVILALGSHVNFSASTPRGLYPTITGRPTRSAWVVACLDPKLQPLARRGLSPEVVP
jgi:type IV secretory pathway protease TraF